jgi:hypothetical protein
MSHRSPCSKGIILPVRFLLAALLCATFAYSQESKETRSPETVRFREFPEILQEIAKEVESNDKAIVVWLLDNAAMLKTSKHGELLAEHLPKLFKKPKISHAVVAMGEQPQLVQKPTDDMARLTTSLKLLANGNPDNAIKNCLANVREAARVAAGASGAKKYLVLFTQENGDNEDNVEETLKALKAMGVVFLPIVPESVYSDPYWASAIAGTSYYFEIEKFKKLPFQLRGPESAFVEFPYGWPFTRADPAYTVPSGFAPYALDRLATYSGGRSFLYSIDRSTFTFCQRFHCRLCSGQHASCGAPFDEVKLKVTAPEIGSRPEYGAKYGREKLYAATLNVWDRLHREGILRGVPPLRAGGSGLSENRAEAKQPTYRNSAEWKSQRQDAIKNAEAIDKVVAEYRETARKFEKESSLRTVATADALAVHLLLVAQGYRQLAAFCDEMMRPKRPAVGDGVATSSLDNPNGEKVIGHFTELYYLCHGGARLKDVAFLGDLAGLHAALDIADQMIEKHRGTPWEMLLRRGSIPIFTPVFEPPPSRGGGSTNDRSRPRSGSTPNTTETPAAPARPARPATGDPGQGGGTATGGNR